jgi:T5SS/PEP-CTERM-associated repeat protein
MSLKKNYLASVALFLPFGAANVAMAADTIYNSGSSSVNSAVTADVGGNIIIGDTGTATLTVTTPGSLTTDVDIYVGNNSASSGTLIVNGGSLTANRYYVGLSGTGTVTLTNGADLITTGVDRKVYVGNFAGATGTLNLSGVGTTLAAHDLNVGWSGDGTMTVSDGATATINQDVTLSKNSYTTGTLTITGAGSSITSDRLYVAESGTGVLNILDHGSYTVTGTSKAYLGWNAGSSGTVNINGAGSSLTAGELTSGWNGDGAVNISGGARATITHDAFIAYYSQSTSSISVSGTGSSLTADRLYVGMSGDASLYVLDGGSVSTSGTNKTYIGYVGDGTGYAEVRGTGSSLQTGELNVGWNGSGSLLVTGGGHVTSAAAVTVGYANGSTGTLTIANNGTVTVGNGTGTLQVGQLAGSTGTVIIGAASGETAVAAGTLNAASVSFGAGTGQLVFNHTSNGYLFAPSITGTGKIFADAGVTTLTGSATGFSGLVAIADGATLGIENGIGGNTRFDVRGTLSGGTGSVDLAGGGNTFNIYNGARFASSVNFNNTSSNTINFYTGSYTMPVLNYALGDVTNAINLLGTAKTLITAGVDGSGDGNIVVVDTSSIANVDRAASDVQRQVSGVLQDIMNLDVARPGPTLAPSAYASTDARPNPANLALKQTKDQAVAIDEAGNLAWVRAFMGARHQDGSDGLASTNGRQFGTLAGADRVFDDWRLGIYAGAGRSTTTLSDNLGSLDANMALAGLYARRGFGAVSLDMALTGGHIWADSERGVNNGAETARGSFNGWFIAPEAALSLDYALNANWKLTPSLRGRYVASFYDDFTETGSSQNVSYDSHVGQSLEERFDTRLTYATVTGAGLSASAWVGAGVSATQRVGNGAYDASVSGVDFAIVAAGDRNVYGATAAAGFDMMIGRSASLFGSVETTFATDDSRTGLVRGGVKIAF